MLDDLIPSFDERDQIGISHTNLEPTANAMSVSEFLQVTDRAVRNFGTAIVVGEISEIKSYSHLYFKIKDENSCVDCVMWASDRRKLSFEPAIGQSVEIIGTSSVYPKTGQFKLIANSIRPLGLGLIMEKLKNLQEKLFKEGVFSYHKRSIKKFINTVGVITSTDGRVVHDIEMTIKRRNPLINIIVYPANVQGEGAAQSLIRALHLANKDNRADVLIIGRGGGSFEDLLPFSDEQLVRETALSEIPIISAVGHEPDFALTDYSCDIRAATPTAAAEIVSSVTKEELISQCDNMISDLNRIIGSLVDNVSFKLDYLTKRIDTEAVSNQLYSKNLLLNNKIAKLNYLLDSNIQLYKQKISSYEAVLSKYEGKVLLSKIDFAINSCINRLNICIQTKIQSSLDKLSFDSRVFKLNNLVNNKVAKLKLGLTDRVNSLEIASPKTLLNRIEQRYLKEITTLENLNPLAILKRGYSITFDDKNHIVDFKEIQIDQKITTRLDKGVIVSKVVKKIDNENE